MFPSTVSSQIVLKVKFMYTYKIYRIGSSKPHRLIAFQCLHAIHMTTFLKAGKVQTIRLNETLGLGILKLNLINMCICQHKDISDKYHYLLYYFEFSKEQKQHLNAMFFQKTISGIPKENNEKGNDAVLLII